MSMSLAMGASLELRCAARGSVRTRVIDRLAQFPASVRELDSAGCGSRASIRRVVRCLLADGGAVRIASRDGRGFRYALRSGARYEFWSDEQ